MISVAVAFLVDNNQNSCDTLIMSTQHTKQTLVAIDKAIIAESHKRKDNQDNNAQWALHDRNVSVLCNYKHHLGQAINSQLGASPMDRQILDICAEQCKDLI